MQKKAAEFYIIKTKLYLGLFSVKTLLMVSFALDATLRSSLGLLHGRKRAHCAERTSMHKKSRLISSPLLLESAHSSANKNESWLLAEVGDLLLMCLRCEKSTSIHSDYRSSSSSSSRRAVARDWQYLTYMYYYGLRLSSLWDKYSIYWFDRYT